MNNQLNPDPQGGESNMTDEQVVKQVYPDARAWEHYPGDWQVGIGSEQVNGSRLITYANDSEQDAWADARARLPEGATTQPTPAQQEEFCPDCGGSLFNHEGIKPCSAQPVPSAESKPQEEGGSHYEPLHDDASLVGIKAGSVVKNKSTPQGKEFWDHVETIAAQVRSQPVADGGGLQADPKHKRRPPTTGGMKFYYIDEADAIFDQLESQLASSQEALSSVTVAHETAMYALGSELTALREALRVARRLDAERDANAFGHAQEIHELRKSMQQAVDKLKYCEDNPFARRQASRLAISLLSPEGSSRS